MQCYDSLFIDNVLSSFMDIYDCKIRDYAYGRYMTAELDIRYILL